jgi:hypothetical protein
MLMARSVASGAAAAMSAPTSTASPEPTEATILATYTLPDIRLGPFQNAILPDSIANDRNLQVGSIGSDMWHGPNDPPDEFWLVFDRGPNGLGTVGNQRRRTFPLPEFSPVILRVQTQNDSINVLQAIPILTQHGKPVTGLPNTEGRDEVPYDYSAQSKSPYNPNGLDTEALVRTSAGDIWLCDEYSPSIVHVDQTGKVLKRYIPEGLTLDGLDYPLAPVLPRIYATRKINRGFEGMTISASVPMKKRSTWSYKVRCPPPTRKRVMPRARHACSSSISPAKSPSLNTSIASTPSKTLLLTRIWARTR